MRKQPVRVGMRRFKSITTACQASNLPYSTLRYRCFAESESMRNYEVERPLQNGRNKRVKGVVVIAKGRRVPSYAVAAAFYGVSINTIRARVMSDSYTSYYLWDTRINQEVIL